MQAIGLACFVSSRLLEHVKLPRFFSHCYLQQTMRLFRGGFGGLGFGGLGFGFGAEELLQRLILGFTCSGLRFSVYVE